MDLHRLGRPLCARIDRAAFLANVREVERLCPQSNAIVVIKANAYGHGMVEMALLAGERDVAVATADEAQVLVDAGVTNRIWVMEGPLNLRCLSLATRHEIVWVVHDVAQIALLQAYSHLPLRICLKFDSGMHRLGLSETQLRSVADVITATPAFVLEAVMTHFATSDEPDSKLVVQQMEAFDAMLANCALQEVPQTLANSGGVLFYPRSHRSWVRPGIMLYGAMPAPEVARHESLRPVMRLESAVIALRSVAAGESVGYGAKWTASKASTIATVAVGYADGYPRHAPNGTPVWLNGQRAPLAGRVSMDMICIDVTDLPPVSVGDPVELWGQHIAVDEIAVAANTIAYDLLTGVSARVPREYI